MNITSFEFALFFAVVLPLNWLLRSFSGAYRLFLLLASYVFYASFNAKFLLILLVFSFLTWFFAVVFAETSDARFRRFCLILYVGFSLGMLIFFKYYEMLYISADWLFRLLSISSPVPLLDVIMPIGISFFTFQGMSYAIDVYRDPGKVERSLVEVFCFISFFPTILSGPILRAGNFLGQLQKQRPEQVDFTRAFYLLTRGLVKKIIISSYLSEHIVRVTFGAPSGYSSAAVLTGLGWFDKLAKRAGAGTLVPITGFANAMVSPALEFKSEGFITGTAAKLFVVAGPVLVYGISASILYGLLLYFLGG